MKNYLPLFIVLLLFTAIGCDEDSDDDSTPVVRSEAFTEQFEAQSEICKNRWKEHEENDASLAGSDVFIECNFCKCTKDGLDCENNDCSSCAPGETKEYQCENGFTIPWCECLSGKWEYNTKGSTSEDVVEQCSQCKASDGNWYPGGYKMAAECNVALCLDGSFASDAVECPYSCSTPGEKKNFECSNGKKVPWCECVEESGRLILNCTDRVDKNCDNPQPVEGEEYKTQSEICKNRWKEFEENGASLAGSDVFIECNFCKCTKDGLDCENNDCSSCTPGEKRDYKCENEFTFLWSECGDDGKWNYNANNVTADEIKEKCLQCADGNGNWYPDGYSMTNECRSPLCSDGYFAEEDVECYPCPEVGEKKDFTCPDGTKVPWCECVEQHNEYSETAWRCVVRADLTCSAE